MRTRSIAQIVMVGMVMALVGTGSTAQSAAEPGTVRFVAAGDFGATPDTSAVLAGMAAAQPDLALALGDLSYGVTGQEQAWCDFVTERVGAGFPFELLAGNHESDGANGNINDFSACLPNQVSGLVGTYGRQWYVDVPRVDPLVRFVMISPALNFPDGTWSYAVGTPRYNWTSSAIDGARSNGIPWVVVGTHKPCLSIGSYACEIGADLQHLLLSKRVDLVLHGHEHLYQRTEQLGLGTGCSSLTPGTFDADCIADADNDMTQGAGTVFATVGTGGTPLRAVNTTDTDAGYMATWSSMNSSAPSHGFLDVRATDSELTANFAATRGTYTDSFVIRRGTSPPPPPNQPPSASFTSSTQGLTATVDASASHDSDGQLRSYAWDFGDGVTGTGVQGQHTYAAPGTYTVRLTVTDDGGATGTTSRSLSVSATSTPVDFAADSFNRTVTNGWGTADVGGAWSVTGTASNLSVTPGAASARTTAGATHGAWLGTNTSTDTDLRLTLSPAIVANGSTYVTITGRRVATNNEYAGKLVFTSSGRINVSLIAFRGNATESVIASAVQLPITYAAGTQINVRLQVTGTSPTTLRLKAWPAGTAEPSTWQRTGTDSGTTLQSAGGVGLRVYLSSAATNGPQMMRISAFSARPTA